MIYGISFILPVPFTISHITVTGGRRVFYVYTLLASISRF